MAEVSGGAFVRYEPVIAVVGRGDIALNWAHCWLQEGRHVLVSNVAHVRGLASGRFHGYVTVGPLDVGHVDALHELIRMGVPPWMAGP